MGNSRLRPRQVFRPLVNPVAAFLIKMKLSPNKVTAIGVMLSTLAPFLMAAGGYLPFGVLVFIVGFMDGVDGAIARITKSASKWGGFLDSLLDRYGDSIILLSYLFDPLTSPLGEAPILGIPFRIWICAAIVGSLMVSYARAKSEAVGVTDSYIGMAARSERLMLLSITGILGILNQYVPLYGVILVAILANVTALQRTVHTHATLRKLEKPPK